MEAELLDSFLYNGPNTSSYSSVFIQCVVELGAFCSTLALTHHFACSLHQLAHGSEVAVNIMLAVVGCGSTRLVGSMCSLSMCRGRKPLVCVI